MVEGRNESNKEIGINKPTAFDGSRKKVETFIQECRLYLQVNKKIYATDEAKVAFFLSFMTEKEVLKWKQTFLRSITNDDGEMNFPTIKDFVGLLNSYFKPTNQTQDAKQGKKTAEEIVLEFRPLISQAGYSSDTPSDHLHLIEKLQNVLNPALVKKIMLLDSPPTTIEGWVDKAILIDSQYRMTMDVLGRKTSEGKTNKPAKNYFGARRSQERDPDAMDIDAMTTEKQAVLMRKGTCFICEEPGHMAWDHKEYEAKKGRTWGNTSPPQKKTIKEIHALLQELSPQEKKELLELQSTSQKKEEKEDDEDF